MSNVLSPPARYRVEIQVQFCLGALTFHSLPPQLGTFMLLAMIEMLTEGVHKSFPYVPGYVGGGDSMVKWLAYSIVLGLLVIKLFS